ncbi:hypothetical protein CWI36_1386p0010 [Hamiltosporidium magnivora]|uniref:Uncharacterized protein n=2 Tax=Hamiltosporidium magnivora TaxID=148818 RepID=A0A4Q9L1K9_9MICR|nr:hypothetical protein CWI36_1386p0010 [Hamiltosporidium magnivora]
MQEKLTPFYQAIIEKYCVYLYPIINPHMKNDMFPQNESQSTTYFTEESSDFFTNEDDLVYDIISKPHFICEIEPEEEEDFLDQIIDE